MKKYDKNISTILGVNISLDNKSEILFKIGEFLKSKTGHKIYTPNPEICLLANRDHKFKKLLNFADINIADGFGLKVGAAILGQKIPNRLTGVDLTWDILNIASQNGYRVMLLGGAGKVAKTAAKNIKQQLPNINIVGAGEGIEIKYQRGSIAYDINKNNKVLDFINKAQADIVFVAFDAAKQVYWIDQNLLKLKTVKLAMGVGGTFDFMAAKVKRSPSWLRKIGLEWLFRLLKQPKRIKRILNAVIVFPLICLKWRIGWLCKYRPNLLNIIYNKNNEILLMLNPRFNYWTLPQGGVEKNEDLRSAGKRELNEELGLPEDKIELIKILPDEYKYDWPDWARLKQPYKGQKQKFAQWRFMGEENDFKFRRSDEAQKIQWVKKENIFKVLAKVRQETIKKIFDKI
ncbi:MAG TPA: WecB/TagA/CpsF family glycosyltransferase [Candidatus Bipolaricaulota bacterium]|nr:WecB/TagA/CpsF family glycosyltransferase [Candidatus Bipolaricaulota bacterium]